MSSELQLDVTTTATEAADI